MPKSNFIVRGGADFSGLYKGFNTAQTRMGVFQAGISKTLKGIGVALGGLAIGKLIKDSTAMAMGVESAMDNISRNMGNSSDAFNKWVKTQSMGLGMARADAYKYGSTFSNLLGSFIADAQTTASETQNLMKAAAVISSKTGRAYVDTANRIRSGMLGSTEAIEDLGIYTQVSMLESTNAFKKFANGKSWAQLDFKLQQQIRLAAILEQTYNRYGDTLADTTQTRQAQFIASLKNIQLSLGQAFLPIYNAILPALTAMVNAIGRVVNVISQFSQALFGVPKKQAAATTQQAGAVTDLGDAYKDAGKKAKGALAGFDEINQISDSSGGAGDIGIGGSADLGSVSASEPDINIEPMSKSLEYIKTLAGEIKDFFVSAFGPAIGDAVKSIAPHLLAWKDSLLGLFADVAAWGEPLKNWFLNDLVPYWAEIIAVGGQMFGGWLESMLKVFDTFKAAVIPIFTWFIEKGLPLLTNFASGCIKVFNEIYKTVKDIFDTIWGGVVNPFLKLFSRIVIDTLDIIKKWWDDWGTKIVDGLKLAFENIRNLFDQLWYNFLQPIVNTMIETMAWLWDNHLKGLVEELWTFIGKLMEGVLEIWNQFIAPILGFLIDKLGPTWANTFQFIVEILGTIIGTVIDIVKNLITALGGIIDFIVGVLTGDWEKAWEGLKTAFENIFIKPIESLFKGVINAIIDGINYMIRAINKLNVTVPKIPGITEGFTLGFNIPTIPKLAKGGITNGPMHAIVGDNPGGKEVISPLSDLQDMIASAVGSAMMAAMQFNTSNNDQSDIFIQMDGTTLARVSRKYVENENGRVGKPMIVPV